MQEFPGRQRRMNSNAPQVATPLSELHAEEGILTGDGFHGKLEKVLSGILITTLCKIKAINQLSIISGESTTFMNR